MDPAPRPTTANPPAPAGPVFASSGPAPVLPGLLDEEPGQHVPGSFLSALPQFFVFPLILVATLAVAWLGLRMLAGTGPDDARSVVAEIRAADGPHARWQAMHELADGLQRGRLSLESVPAADLAALWKQCSVAQGDSPEALEQTAMTRGWLLEVIAWKRSPELTPIVLEALAKGDATERFSALGALAQMRDPASAEALAGVLREGTGEERFVAMGALGRLASDGCRPAADAVAGQLGGADGVLARNAVLALADVGDPRAAAGLPALLVRGNYEGDASLDGPDAAGRDAESRAAARDTVVEQFLVSACKAAGKSRDPALLPLLQALCGNDPSLKVRSAAIDALHDRGESPENS